MVKENPRRICERNSIFNYRKMLLMSQKIRSQKLTYNLDKHIPSSV